MNLRALLTGLLLMAITSITSAQDDRFRELVPDPAKLEKLGSGMKFVEGPVWSEENGGFLIFSDIPASELKKWSKADGVTTFRKESNNTNGNARDLEGRLISCEHTSRRVSITEKDGTVRTLVDRFKPDLSLPDGKKFNSPNDVVVKSGGTILFTDPTYGTPKGAAKELEGQWVFCYAPHTKAVWPVAKDMDMPNGLCFSPDESKLYVADSGKPRHILVFEVTGARNSPSDEGHGGESLVPLRLYPGQVFCTIDKGVPDGIRCDEKGNVWSSAGDGVQVFAPDGKLIGRIPVPESPANLCFGGADGKTLFITARTSLYAIETNVRGAKRPSK